MPYTVLSWWTFFKINSHFEHYLLDAGSEPETGKARLPTVERLNGGIASWLEEADRSLCWDGT